jgi:hypothetical protein
MYVPRCRYIKTNGLVCRSPSLKDRCYCYFHTRVNDRHRVYKLHQNTVDSPATGAPLTISALEDTESVQLALSVVVNALAAGDLDPQRARALLYGLQLAANNARHMKLELYNHSEIAREVESEYDYEPSAPAGDKVEL